MLGGVSSGTVAACLISCTVMAAVAAADGPRRVVTRLLASVLWLAAAGADCWWVHLGAVWYVPGLYSSGLGTLQHVCCAWHNLASRAGTKPSELILLPQHVVVDLPHKCRVSERSMFIC